MNITVPRKANTQGTETSNGSVVWIVAAQDTVSMIVEELQIETEKRMQLELEWVQGCAKVDEEG